jgi:hypothetical protein
MQSFETTNPKVARRCRYDQHRRQKTTLTIEGTLVTGLVHSVMEDKSSDPTRWIMMLFGEPRIAAYRRERRQSRPNAPVSTITS